eukprot:scaffold1401_cov330-Pavlova_lutheri.AAC.107
MDAWMDVALHQALCRAPGSVPTSPTAACGQAPWPPHTAHCATSIRSTSEGTPSWIPRMFLLGFI